MMPAICSFSFAVGVIGWPADIRGSPPRSRHRAPRQQQPVLVAEMIFHKCGVDAGFCAMSLSDTSIEERSIISSLAATSSFRPLSFFHPEAGPVRWYSTAIPSPAAGNPGADNRCGAALKS
jgi:hypothetical protein